MRGPLHIETLAVNQYGKLEKLTQKRRNEFY